MYTNRHFPKFYFNYFQFKRFKAVQINFKIKITLIRVITLTLNLAKRHKKVKN